MPQMAPISWLILFFMFSFSFIIFNIVNYYNFFIKNNEIEKNSKNNNLNKILNWKW